MAQKYKQQSDGRWRTRVWDGTYENGKKHYTPLSSSKSSRDLEKMVMEFEQKRDNGRLVSSSAMSIQDYAREWRQSEKGLSESATKAMYDNVIEVHLKDFKTLEFEYLTRQTIQRLINSNAAKPRTCQQIAMTLKQICKSAERDRLLPSGKTTELFDGLQLPKYKAEEKRPLTDEQSQRVLNALVTHELAPRSALFLSFIYFCGLRREEALALKIEDIHSLSVTVNKAIHLNSKSPEIKTPKTERGYRTVPLPAKAIEIINHDLALLTPSCDGHIFTMQNGELMTHSSYVKMWENIEKKLGFSCTAHQFRHNYCTRLCYEAYENRTISVKQIARLLGDTEKMVNDVYGHLVEERENTTEAITSVFGNSKTSLGNEMVTNNSKKGTKRRESGVI